MSKKPVFLGGSSLLRPDFSNTPERDVAYPPNLYQINQMLYSKLSTLPSSSSLES